MDENGAVTLIQQYIQGWTENNLELIVASLAEDCLIIESHGPAYQGIPSVEQWFRAWLEADSSVLAWDIYSFSYCVEQERGFCEWYFSCLSNNIKYDLLGISVIEFSAQKISLIHEYRMTRPPYEWDGLTVVSE